MMRIAIGSIFQESHSFSPVPGSWDHFGPREREFGIHAGAFETSLMLALLPDTVAMDQAVTEYQEAERLLRALLDVQRRTPDPESVAVAAALVELSLYLLKQQKYPIPAFVEYEHRGTGTPVEEVRKCMAYMKQALA